MDMKMFNIMERTFRADLFALVQTCTRAEESLSYRSNNDPSLPRYM